VGSERRAAGDRPGEHGIPGLDHLPRAARGLGRLRLYYPVVGSTNDVARALAGAGFPHGTVVVADVQTAGRGRQGRRWQAPPGAALLCSTLLRPALPVAALPALTMAAADAAAAVTGRPAALKWPNDVLMATAGAAGRPAPPALAQAGESEPPLKKVAGVLLETALAGHRLASVIVGIGINVSAHPPELATATDLAAVAGRPIARAAVLDALLARLDHWAGAALAGEQAAVFAAWRARLVTLGRPVHVVTAGEAFDGLAEDVDTDGALLVRVAGGGRRRLLAADVTLSHERCVPAGGA
jgi:BirA family biotin operon repressor/biotin-[acetyl-CoA-carboxylase] ligase